MRQCVPCTKFKAGTGAHRSHKVLFNGLVGKLRPIFCARSDNYLSVCACCRCVCIYVRGQVLLNRKYTAYLIRGDIIAPCKESALCATLSPPRLDQVALSLTRGSRQETRSYRVKWSELTFSLNKISTHWELYQRRDLIITHSRRVFKAGFKHACCRGCTLHQNAINFPGFLRTRMKMHLTKREPRFCVRCQQIEYRERAVSFA